MNGGATPMPPVVTTLVTGASPALREAAIAAVALPAACILLEGLPDGRANPLEHADVHRIAPGCLCCTGNLVLRVTLNRLLRRHPERLYIGLASTEHLDQLRSWLSAPPYDQLLALTPDLAA
jgi:hypothetical protein